MTAEHEHHRVSRLSAWLLFALLSAILFGAWLYVTRRESPSLGEGAIGRQARLDLSLRDLDGRDITLSSFKGKVILLNFWATWCGPCKTEIPDLVSLQSSIGSRLAVVGVLVLDPIRAGTAPFVRQYRMSYPVLDGNDREDVEAAFGPIWALPTTVIVSPDGRIAVRHTGPMTQAQFERVIKPMLRSPYYDVPPPAPRRAGDAQADSSPQGQPRRNPPLVAND
jgi:thiol-disulfide isomerase/thioredoxin